LSSQRNFALLSMKRRISQAEAMRSTQRFFTRGPGPPLEVGAGETANFTCRRQRFAASRRFERRKGRLRLALRLAGKIIDGDQRREVAP
jgi:hypothetical protein